jgi:protein-L-isoaspartate(D-aspartate) O-methyltransferase
VTSRDDLTAALIAGGKLPAAWAPAFDAIDRGAFIPRRMWCDDTHGQPQPIDRDTDPDRWDAAVYSDTPIVTQLDDGKVVWPDTSRLATSSASQPSVVLTMLEALNVREGDRVLEIGTGTGYNAALLAHRVGAERVTTVEVDLMLVEQAWRNLADVDAKPAVVCGDGAEGYRDHAPYDRIISTAAVLAGQIPYAWVEQTRPGGRIVTPWGTSFRNGELVSLTVQPDGTAQGSIVDTVAFMRLRDQRAPLGASRLSTLVDTSPAAVEKVTSVPPGDLVLNDDGEFAAGLFLSGVQSSVWWDNTQSDSFEVLLFEVASESAATVRVTPEHTARGEYPVRQYGARRLWDDAEIAHAWWIAHGQPDRTRFGLTVTADRQTVWLDHPARVITR